MHQLCLEEGRAALMSFDQLLIRIHDKPGLDSSRPRLQQRAISVNAWYQVHHLNGIETAMTFGHIPRTGSGEFESIAKMHQRINFAQPARPGRGNSSGCGAIALISHATRNCLLVGSTRDDAMIVRCSRFSLVLITPNHRSRS